LRELEPSVVGYRLTLSSLPKKLGLRPSDGFDTDHECDRQPDGRTIAVIAVLLFGVLCVFKIRA